MTSPRPRVTRWNRSALGFSGGALGVIVLLVLVPFGFTQTTTSDLTQLLTLVLLASMWNALAGFGGMVSIGQQAFIGIGAYGTIILASHGVNGYVAIVIAALAAGVIALPISLIAFRLRGGQFAIGMWVIAESFRLFLDNDGSLGGGSGNSFNALNSYSPSTRDALTFWLALGLTAALLGGVVVLLRSRTGASLQAIRDDEVAAASVGVRVTRIKRLIFVLAAVGCAAAGGLILASSLFVEPDSIFSVQYSAYMIFMVLIGGLGTFEGPIIGALFFYFVQQQFAGHGTWYLIGLGALAIAITQLLPRGIWGSFSARFGIQLVPIGYRVRVPDVPAADAEAAPTATVNEPATTSEPEVKIK
jgi:branched-chain amino acid transport system permease protein